MQTLLQDRKAANTALVPVCQPVFYRLSQAAHQQQLAELLAGQPHIQVFDELEGQLQELLKSRNPSVRFTPETLRQAVTGHLAGTDPEQYGVWVYYPWAARLVHILDQEEFVFLRTSRNQYKITPEERDLLATKRIGVVGLSVGQAVAVTMAMERLFGEIRLADFDTLELTNLNRIRTGLHNLGLSKAVAVAREILEIDPYLHVTCYTDGLTEQNMDDFFTKDGLLDVLVEECDSVDIKVQCRYKARALHIPVVMEMSDRGMVDVERFDLEPDRSILHGLLDHLDIEKLKTLTTSEEKLPYMLPMVGFEAISARLKASALEIGHTLTTWPQLASAVAFGGGLTADVVRRVLLGHFTDSGRYYADPEEMVGNRKAAHAPQPPEPAEALGRAAMLRIADAFAHAEESMAIAESTISELVEAANLAPSAGNNQPWCWLYRHNRLFLFLNRAQLYPFWKANDWFAYVGLGAALENLALAAGKHGLEAAATLLPDPKQPELAAVVRLVPSATAPAPLDRELADGIPVRLTNRLHSLRTSLSEAQRAALQAAVQTVAGARLHLLHEPAVLAQAAGLITACERIRFLHPEGHREFFQHEVRWNRAESEARGDGLDLRTFDLSPSDMSGLRLARQPEVVGWLRAWRKGKGLEKFSSKLIANSSAVALVSVPQHEMAGYLHGGRAVQRIWLAANLAGVACQPVMAPLYMFAHVQVQPQDFSEDMQAELSDLEYRLAQLFGLEEGRQAVFLLRLSVAGPPSVRSVRRPLSETLVMANMTEAAGMPL